MKKKYFTEEEKKKAHREANRRYYQEHKEKTKEATRRWRENHVEAVAEISKRYRKKNLEKVKGLQKHWRENNKEKAKEATRRWREENPMLYRANNLVSAYRQCDRKANRGQCTLTSQWIVENIFSQPCVHCGESDWTKIGCNRLDNSKPHTEDNVEPCCFECNIKLGVKDRKRA